MRADLVHVVLECDGHTGKGAHLGEGAVGDGGVQLGGLGKRKLVGDLEERVDIGVDRGNARKRSLGDLTCRELLVGQTGLDLTDAHGCEIVLSCH